MTSAVQVQYRRGTSTQVASFICGAVVSATPLASARLRATGPVTTTVLVNGKPVVITGTFTK